MSTTLTPPPLPPQPPLPGPPASAPPPGRRTSSRVVAILAIVVGGVILLGTVFSGVFTAVRSAATHTDTLTAPVAGLSGLDLDVDAADFRVVYGSGTDSATLEVTGGTGAASWRLERDGGTLVVSAHRDWWGGAGWFGGTERAVLTLPARVADTPLDATVDVSGGSATITGTYTDLEVGLSAGAVDVSGSAREVAVDVSAGHARLDLDGVGAASAELSAGQIEGVLAGPLRDLDVDVSAGRLELTVPDETYEVVSEVSAGEFRHDLDTAARAERTISATVSAGAAILHAAR